MKRKRMAELAALMVVGDGVLTAVSPRRHLDLWACGPEWYRNIVRGMTRRPRVTRGLGVAAAALGLYWASRQKPQRRRFLLF